MVKMCHVCRRVDYLNPHLSFHRLPVDPKIRKKWIEILNLKQIPKSPLICCDHFFISDFKITKSGKKCLYKNACPLPFRLASNETDIDPLAINPTMVKMEIKYEIDSDNEIHHGHSTPTTVKHNNSESERLCDIYIATNEIKKEFIIEPLWSLEANAHN